VVLTVEEGAGAPLLSILWTVLLVCGVAVFAWLLVTVLADVFRRDLAGWAKMLWVLAVLVLPIVASLTYLATRSRATGELSLRRRGDAELRMAAYQHEVTGDGAYRGIRDETRTRQAWDGPMRPS
jgi:hypothetical protein